VEEPPPSEAVPRLLASMRRACRAQDALYPLRRVLPALGRFFAEPAAWPSLPALDPEPAPGVSVGLHRAGGERGGFTLYVPERYTPERGWPLVVALHGGWGHGADFLWTWLREARSRGCLLLAPTSRGSTWSLHPPDVDAPALVSMLAYVRERWNVDPERMLLTGLSDGASYTLLWGLSEASPFSHLAPLCGVLHPDNVGRGNLGRARGRRIWLGHGARDWLFPVELARLARDTLLEAGAELVYREIADLAHAYPREENARILEWMDPGLALAGPRG
jgi:phospholipase/carboxylesterase